MDGIKCEFSELIKSSVEACEEMSNADDNMMTSAIMFQKEDPNKEPIAWIVGSYTKLVGTLLGIGIGLSNGVLDEVSTETLKYYISIALAVNTVEADGLLGKLGKEIFHPDLVSHAALIKKIVFSSETTVAKEEAVALLQEAMSKIIPKK
jgi:hypothetical protein